MIKQLLIIGFAGFAGCEKVVVSAEGELGEFDGTLKINHYYQVRDPKAKNVELIKVKIIDTLANYGKVKKDEQQMIGITYWADGTVSLDLFMVNGSNSDTIGLAPQWDDIVSEYKPKGETK